MAKGQQYGADQIVELEFLEAVRLRPGMYIGNNNTHGLHHILLEILDNSVDECMAGYATTIKVIIAPDGTVTQTDDGRGIPVDWKPDSGMSVLTQVLTRPHAGGKFGGDDSAYSSSGGLHGIGSKCTNAFSSRLDVEVCRHGLRFRQRFERGGIPVTGVEIFDSKGKQKLGEINADTQLATDKKDMATALVVKRQKQPIQADPALANGTMIRFRPNRAWFSREMEWHDPDKSVPWDASRLDSRFRQIAHLYPGVRIEFTDQRQPKAEKQVYFSKFGLVDYIAYLNEGEDVLHKPIVFKSTDEIDTEGGKATIETEVAIQYAGEETQMYSFVNAIPTPLGGTHVAAFKAALTKAVKQFASDKKLLKGDDDIKGDDVLLGLTAIIKITMTCTPQFLSQTKESLTSPEVHGPIFSATYNSMSDYLGKNIPIGKVIVNQAVAAARGRDAASQARKLMIKKSALDAGDVVLGKLADIQRRGGEPTVPREFTALYIVEGDSAGGSCKMARDSRYHAILPLRGKIPNVEKKVKLNELLKNREIAAIIAAIGAGIGTDFDSTTMRYGRVVITTDADVDGAHIGVLLSTLFWRVMRPLIENGLLYIAQPPLYQVKGKSQSQYAYSEAERDELAAAMGGGDAVTVQRYKGLGEMNPEQLRETIFALPETAAERKSKGKRGKKDDEPAAERPLTVADFAHKDLQVIVDDPHRTHDLIERLMGADVEPRKKWLLGIDWSAEE